VEGAKMKKAAFRQVSQEHYFPVVILVHFIFWFIDLALYTGNYEYTNKQVTGEMFSSWVVTVLAFNFLMTTKAKWVERIFGGLDKMYMIHRRSGIIAMVLIFLHFIVIPMDPRFSIGKPLGILALGLILIGVLLAALPVFKRVIKYNYWRNTHKLLGFAYLIGIIHSLNVQTLTSELPIVRTYVYGMAIIGIISWIYTVFLYRLFNRRLSYVVTSTKRFDNDVIEISLKATDQQLQYKPGQFAFFSFDGIGTKEVHPFTLSSNPKEDHLRITVKALGDYTSQLQTTLKQGMKAYVEGAFGHFIYKNAKHKKQLWLAGGIGITPFLPFLKDIGADYEVNFIWTARSNESKNYQDEIKAAAEKKSNLKSVIYNSETQGYFTIGSNFDVTSLKNCSIFICGPEMMRESYIKQLLEKGVSIKDIYYEEFLFR
jgi:predicted ferric reductase